MCVAVCPRPRRLRIRWSWLRGSRAAFSLALTRILFLTRLLLGRFFLAWSLSCAGLGFLAMIAHFLHFADLIILRGLCVTSISACRLFVLCILGFLMLLVLLCLLAIFTRSLFLPCSSL